MTRINAGIKVKLLHYKHLLAEHRELKRIPNQIKAGKYVLKGSPDKFTLGTGHVKFFYNKLLYLKKRYEDLYRECIRRGYNPTYFGAAFDDLPKHLMNDWIPTEEAKHLLEERIKERLKTMKI